MLIMADLNGYRSSFCMKQQKIALLCTADNITCKQRVTCARR